MRNFFLKLILLIGLQLVIIAVLNFGIDPMRFYRNPVTYDIGEWRKDERILNAGIIRNSQFDSIIIGSSMIRNFDIQNINERFNWKTIKLAMSAATQRDILYTYNFVNEINPRFKNIILGVDIETFFEKENFQKIKFDETFYVKHRRLNFEYLLNFRTLKYTLEFLKLNLLKNEDEIAKMYKLGYQYEYKKENVLKLIKQNDNLNNSINGDKIEFNNKLLENMKNNYKKNLKIILDKDRDKNFYLFFPPYSIYYYDNLINNKNINEYYIFKKFLIEELQNYKNVKLYDFQDIDFIIKDLDNYGDLMHFSPEVSQQLLEYMLEYKYKVN